MQMCRVAMTLADTNASARFRPQADSLPCCSGRGHSVHEKESLAGTTLKRLSMLKAHTPQLRKNEAADRRVLGVDSRLVARHRRGQQLLRLRDGRRLCILGGTCRQMMYTTLFSGC